MGVSLRVNHPPVNVELGRSLLFFAHDEGQREDCKACRGTGVKSGLMCVSLHPGPGIDQIVRSRRALEQLNRTTSRQTHRRQKWVRAVGQKKCTQCGGRGRRPVGSVFGFARIDRCELVFDRSGAAREWTVRHELYDRHKSIPITPVVSVEFGEQPRRCGYRQIGAYYLVSDKLDLSTEFEGLADKLGINWSMHNPLIVFQTPAPYTGQRWGGTKAVSRTDIFNDLKAKAKAKAKRKRARRGSRRRTSG